MREIRDRVYGLQERTPGTDRRQSEAHKITTVRTRQSEIYESEITRNRCNRLGLIKKKMQARSIAITGGDKWTKNIWNDIRPRGFSSLRGDPMASSWTGIVKLRPQCRGGGSQRNRHRFGKNRRLNLGASRLQRGWRRLKSSYKWPTGSQAQSYYGGHRYQSRTATHYGGHSAT